MPVEIARLGTGPIEYRLERRGPEVVLVFHGGHMNAGIALGEDPFADAGYSVLAPSRPGYGRTPLSTGSTPEQFADAVAPLVRHLGFDSAAAAVGISAGGPHAITLAVRHPSLVGRLILQSSLSSLPWPSDRMTRIAGRVAFNRVMEGAAWAGTRVMLRLPAHRGLAALLGRLSTKRGGEVVAALGRTERDELVDLFSAMRSGRGFGNDLRTGLDPEVLRTVQQPTLVMASHFDGSVPFEHVVQLTRLIPGARLFVSDAPSHLIWFGGTPGAIGDEVRAFLE